MPKSINRRSFMHTLGASAFVTGMGSVLPKPAWAQSAPGGVLRREPRNRYDLDIAYMPFQVDGQMEPTRATAINGAVPGPLIHLREGDAVQLNVTNSLMDTKHASIHWHGLLVPYRMDGVPGVSFRGIKPGETFPYRFTLKQSGTYWYHSHSAFQEQTGTYGPLVIEPKDPEPVTYDRDYAIVLSDWTSVGPHTVFRNITLNDGYYNYQQRTVGEFFKDVREDGFKATIAERMAWGKMRMSPVDLADVTGVEYTYLMNGQSPDANWTALFNPGETIRLRFINAAAMSTFDVRIPGLDMEVVMVDGKWVKPVEIHEFRISVAETYDVLVRPRQDEPYTVFAESLDRSGFARGSLSPELGLEAPIPPLRPRPVRTLEDIGMGGMDDMIFGGEMDHGSMNHTTHSENSKDASSRTMHQSSMAGHGDESTSNKPSAPSTTTPGIPGPVGPKPFLPPNNANVAMINKNPRNRIHEPGLGLGEDGWKVLTLADLESNEPQPYPARVDREMTINLTGNMERYIFTFDGKQYSQHPGPYLFRHNERLRLWLVNHTMMEHPIHLHGMWMQIENGRPHEQLPFKHTILMRPGEKLSTLITPIEKGDWAFHCHLLYHMEAGMFQVVRVA